MLRDRRCRQAGGAGRHHGRRQRRRRRRHRATSCWRPRSSRPAAIAGRARALRLRPIRRTASSAASISAPSARRWSGRPRCCSTSAAGRPGRCTTRSPSCPSGCRSRLRLRARCARGSASQLDAEQMARHLRAIWRWASNATDDRPRRHAAELPFRPRDRGGPDRRGGARHRLRQHSRRSRRLAPSRMLPQDETSAAPTTACAR